MMYTIFKTSITTLLIVGYSILGHSQQDTTNKTAGFLIGKTLIDYHFLEQKIASQVYQGLCMRRIIRESETMGFNITIEMTGLKEQLEALSRSHVLAMYRQHLGTLEDEDLEDIQQAAEQITDRFINLEDRLLNDCPDGGNRVF